MDLLALLFPKEKKFYRMVEEQVILIGDGISAFEKLVKTYNKITKTKRSKIISQIETIEKKDDLLYTKMVKSLKSTFITPMDREDIHKLVFTLDMIIDSLEKVSQKFEAYDINFIENHVVRQTELLNEAYAFIRKIIFSIKNEEEVEKFSLEVRKLENEADRIFICALRDLFKGSKDPIKIIKMRDIYSSLELLIDRISECSLIIENLTVKYS